MGAGVVKNGVSGETVVVLVVDSELVSMGFMQALSTRHNLHVAAVAHNAADGWKAIARASPDVVIIETGLAREVKALAGARGWRARTILLGRNAHVGIEPAASVDAACGFISFSARRRHYLPIVDRVSTCAAPCASADACCRDCPVRATLAPQPLGLTGRESEVFVRIGCGFRAAEIAAELGVSAKTVDAHRESIKHKLGLESAHALNVAAAGWCRGEALVHARRAVP
jgi:DNA-binding NarL/FixJ family response regulator